MYPEFPEKPLGVIGTRSIEKFSDNRQRVLSMTGGTTVPTPKIEANESLSLPFYMHDCYHIAIDCAMGIDRAFWNAFGSHLREFSRSQMNPDLQLAFQTLAEFCLDKEFANYHDMPKDMAFVTPLIGMYMIAGKAGADNPDEPFQPISNNPEFTPYVRKLFLECLQDFWKRKLPELPARVEILEKRFVPMLPHVIQGIAQTEQEVPDLRPLIHCLSHL